MLQNDDFYENKGDFRKIFEKSRYYLALFIFLTSLYTLTVLVRLNLANLWKKEWNFDGSF